VGRAAGVPEAQLVSTLGGEDIACGDEIVVHGLPSAHGRAYFNRVPLPGNITEPPRWPPRFWDLRHGQVLNWWIRGHGISIVHIDSAEFFADALQPCDILCLCAIGRRYRPNYVAEAIERMRPRYVVPCHWDWFFSPYRTAPRQLPLVDLEGFLEEIRAAGSEPILLPIDGHFSFKVAP
jgi:L-ascorbate metabolism protein UlaG (beta-lactamase superfamily)